MQDEQSGESQQPGYGSAARPAAEPEDVVDSSTPADGEPAPEGMATPAAGGDGPMAQPGGYGYMPPAPPAGYGPDGYGQPGGYGPQATPPQATPPQGTPPQGTPPPGTQPGAYTQPGYYGPAGGYSQASGYGYGTPGGYGQAPSGYSGGSYGPSSVYGPGSYGSGSYASGGGYGSGGYGSGGYGSGGYGGGGYPPPPPGGFGAPGDYIQQGRPPRRRLTGVVAYIAVAAVAAAAGAGTVLVADHVDSPSHSAPSAGSNPAGNGGFGNGGFGQPNPQPSPSSQVSSATEQAVYNAVQPGIVDITSSLQYQGGTAAATGMVISKSGLVLTNNHVINGTTGLTAKVVATGQHFTARFLGYDKSDDVAVLQLQNASNLRTVPLGNSSDVKLGDGVVALGNAEGSGQTATVTGSITGLNQTITASDDGSNTRETLTNMLRTNANIVPGDSGGPLASVDGKVIGMDTAAATGSFGVGQSDVGFAIPINRAMQIAQQIIKGKASGSIRLGSGGFLGVLVPAAKASMVSDPKQQRRLQAEGENSGGGGGIGVPPAGASCIPNQLSAGIPAKVAPVASGALVLGELCGTPAASAGMNPGDVIVSVDGRAVTTPASLTGIMKGFNPGSKVSVTWVSVSSGAKVTKTLTLGTAPPQ